MINIKSKDNHALFWRSICVLSAKERVPASEESANLTVRLQVESLGAGFEVGLNFFRVFVENKLRRK